MACVSALAARALGRLARASDASASRCAAAFRASWAARISRTGPGFAITSRTRAARWSHSARRAVVHSVVPGTIVGGAACGGNRAPVRGSRTKYSKDGIRPNDWAALFRFYRSSHGIIVVVHDAHWLNAAPFVRRQAALPIVHTPLGGVEPAVNYVCVGKAGAQMVVGLVRM
jgi:hypothetical protein